MSVSFDKRLAELDAYLQMLIEETETIGNKLNYVDSESEKESLTLIRNHLDTLIRCIKHAIVLLQIAKVSIRTSPTLHDKQKAHSNHRYKQPQQQKINFQLSTPTADGSTATSSSPFTAEFNLKSKKDDLGEDDDEDEDAFFDAAGEQELKYQLKLEENIKTATDRAIDENLRTSLQTSQYHLNNSLNFSQTTQQEAVMANNPIINNNNNSLPIEDSSIDWDSLYDEEEEDLGSLENQGSVIKHLMSQIRIGMDLTKVVLPTFILERRSLLEMYADFFAHPDLFSSIANFESPEERFLQLVKWYLSAFHAGRKSSVAKKPYNPILGEIFSCHWDLNDSERLRFIAEQVSHHPPVSAFYAENSDKQISCTAHIYTKSKYLGLSVGVHNIGEGVVKLLKHNESYTCTFPSAFGRSILTVPWVELGGTVSISCKESGYTAKVEFVTKPFYGGKKHRVLAELHRPNKELFMSIEGEWNGCMYSKSPPNSGVKNVFVDTTSLSVIKKSVRSIGLQEPLESRNVWKEVTRALKLHDVTSATAAKSFIEQRQRDLLKERVEKGTKWKTRYFNPSDDGWVYGKSSVSFESVDSSSLNESSLPQL